MKHHPVTAVAILLSVALFAGHAAAADMAAGVVRLCIGTAIVVRDGRDIPATPGLRLNERDTLKTGDDGSMGVILRDDTLVSLAPGSVVTLNRFAFSPEADNLGLTLNISKGKAVVHSGKIAKIAPKAVKIETPAMVMGVRGTTFAVGVN